MDKKGYHIAYDASQIYSEDYIGLINKDGYNAAVSHIYDLIRAAYTLFIAQYFAPCLFLTITIFEEIAKIKAGHNRHKAQLKKVKYSKDPLFNHNKKHKIAIDPIYLIGDKIANSIGKQRADEFFHKYENGE